MNARWPHYTNLVGESVGRTLFVFTVLVWLRPHTSSHVKSSTKSGSPRPPYRETRGPGLKRFFGLEDRLLDLITVHVYLRGIFVNWLSNGSRIVNTGLKVKRTTYWRTIFYSLFPFCSTRRLSLTKRGTQYPVSKMVKGKILKRIRG